MNTTTSDLSPPSVWSAFEKISFRFLFCFFLLFIAFKNNGAFPYWEVIFKYPLEGMEVLAKWAGKNILHITRELDKGHGASGDTTFSYTMIFTIATISLLATLVWSLVDKKRINYSTLYYWLTVAVRFYVGLMLIEYGIIKIFKMQFLTPSVDRLMQPYGESSPMGLAWTFLGFSTGYNIFMGIAELLAVFLLFRRTQLFGAIITLMTTVNVMAINYFFDVPVKTTSTMLTVMTLFLLMRDARRMFQFLFTGQAVDLPVVPAPVYTKKGYRIAGLSFKFLLVAYVFIFSILNGFNLLKEYGDLAKKPVFYGYYEVDTFVLNNDTLYAGKSDSVGWKRLSIMPYRNWAEITTRSDSSNWYNYSFDSLNHTMNFTMYRDSTLKYEFTYQRKWPDLSLEGTLRNDSVKIHLIQVDERDKKKFLLMNRGFHWVNETPFNR